MSYEVPLPMPDRLREKPILNASELHRYLEEQGFKPMVVVVDNNMARVTIHFSEELGDKEKLKLQEAVLEWYRKWIGVESS
ncbi:MAG: hypothetical protein LM558_02590 [Thermosphaera sp.]|nr:hypothetical protein [Thermosphaera sp.]